VPFAGASDANTLRGAIVPGDVYSTATMLMVDAIRNHDDVTLLLL